uniref:Malic enzyme n=1 Tax=Fagus sylvatica TaxID=28930 RepID=A0A2N9HTH9_FAGSY
MNTKSISWCCLCKENGETVDHLLLHCPFLREVWDMVFALFGVHWVMPWRVIDLIAFWQDLGLQEHRLDGDEYVAVIDEFMEAVFTRWPNVIVQFEDFESKWAFKLLQRYRNTYRMFNDDVQGTAGVAIAGLLGAVRAQGRPMIDFPKQKIVVAGAGSAGIGVLNTARKTMARMLGNNESAFDSAQRQFWVVDAKGEPKSEMVPVGTVPGLQALAPVIRFKGGSLEDHQSWYAGIPFPDLFQFAANKDAIVSNVELSHGICLLRMGVSASLAFALLDNVGGLITEERENIDPDALPFAGKIKEINRQGLREGASLVEVQAEVQPMAAWHNLGNPWHNRGMPKLIVQQVKPDVLLGLSAVGGLFSKEVLEALKGSTSTRPAIFAMSNPTKNAECTPEAAFSIVGENIIFASGSPFKDVDLENGLIGHCNQGNNMYLFPGIGLGTLLSGSRIITDGMLQAAAECLAAYMTEEEVLNGIIFPSISSIRDITKEVAAAVVKEAIEEDLAEGYRGMDARELRKLSQEEIVEYVKNNMWSPEYPKLVYRND